MSENSCYVAIDKQFSQRFRNSRNQSYRPRIVTIGPATVILIDDICCLKFIWNMRLAYDCFVRLCITLSVVYKIVIVRFHFFV